MAQAAAAATLASRAALPRASPAPRRSITASAASASASASGSQPTPHAAAVSRRRSLSAGGAAALLSLALPGEALAKLPSGFNPVVDKGDNYRFLYPFGWQEVTVEGQDIVFKDIIEPLESVSVTISPTDRSDISEFGELNEVCLALADTVLTSPGQEVKLLSAEGKAVSGINYYEFQFAAKAPNYIRRAVSVVAVYQGKFYALTTGANERRWPKMEEKLKTVAKSFQVGVL